MTTRAPDRERKGKGSRCSSKSRPPRLSAGPPSGVRDDPPISKDPESNGGPEPLSELDIMRISRCVLDLLVKPPLPPSPEGEVEEVPGVVGPQLASRVLASFGSLARHLRVDLCHLRHKGHPVFVSGHVTNGKQGDCPFSPGSSASPPECGVAEARGLAAASVEVDGPRITQPQGPPVTEGTGLTMTGHSWARPGALPPAFVPHGVQAGSDIASAFFWDPLQDAKLEVSWCRHVICDLREALARQHEAHLLEVRRLLLELELVRMRVHDRQASPPPSVEAPPSPGECGVGARRETRQGEVPTPATEGHGNTQNPRKCRAPRPLWSPSAHFLETEDLHELTLKPRDASLDAPGDRRHGFTEQLQLCRDQSGPALRMYAVGTGRKSSLDGDKMEAKISRVVASVKEQLPTYPESEVRRHVEHVRSLQHGFSGMAFRSIVALVLGHIRGLSVHGDH